jgi:hypothetical protein
MQRLFSSFPTGAPGGGLILLRLVAALSLQTDASGHLALTAHTSLPGVALVVLSLALLIGLLTPVAALTCAALEAAMLFTSTPPGTALMLQGPVMCVALALLGPGAYSFDARLFGSRIVVLHSSDQPED